MKTKLCRKAKQLASSLLVVLVICTILSVSVAGYLSLIEQQNMLSTRSQNWNIAIALVEAGIEEGLEHLNTFAGNLATEGWAAIGGFQYSRSQTLADGNSYTVTIDNTYSASPTVTARASINLPAFAQNRVSSFFATIGSTQPAPDRVARAVRVRCTKSSLFSAPMVAKRGIDLNGNGIYTDSYDSSDPAKSTFTRYDRNKYSGDRGDIASNGGIVDSIGMQNANIYGIVHTGPGQPVSLGAQGGVGPHGNQATTVQDGINMGYIIPDSNFTFPDTTMPSTAGLFPAPAATIVAPIYHFDTNWTTSVIYPNPPPLSGVVTNTTYYTVLIPPSPLPTGLTSNATWHTVGSLPYPIPGGTTTNIATRSVTSDTYPESGTYVGGVTVNTAGNSSNIKSYTYNQITGITYTYATYTYTYPIHSYIYPLIAITIQYSTNHYDHVVSANTTNTANYSSSGNSYYIAGPDTCLIMPNGLTGSESFTIAPGASVLIYAGGTSLTLNGNQVLNPNGLAGSFIVYAAPSVTTFTLNGNAEFTGVLVAPNADLTMNGSGSQRWDFSGSLMVNSVKMNGRFSFHWDEALDHFRNNGRYIVASWDEINPNL